MTAPLWKRWWPGARQDEAAAAEVGGAPTTRVLMVCTGNICRSPIAEGVLRERLKRAGLAGQVEVDSAGTHGYHTGEAPDPRAVRAAAQHGYDIAGQHARPVVDEDFTRFDWLLAMDGDNLAWLQRHAPAGSGVRIELLMSHARRHGEVREVPDPYYGPPAGFEQVLALVEDACDGFVARLNELPGELRKA